MLPFLYYIFNMYISEQATNVKHFDKSYGINRKYKINFHTTLHNNNALFHLMKSNQENVTKCNGS